MPEELTITVDGASVTVAPGSTVAAAVAVAGVSACCTSVTGEPRGPLCGMGTCFECRVTIDGVDHRRGCRVLCAAGMVVQTDVG